MKYKDAKIENIDPKIRDLINSIATREETRHIFLGEIEPRTVQKIVGFEKGVFLYGSTGTGKTYTLHAIKNSCDRKQIKTFLENWIEILMELRSDLTRMRETIRAILSHEVIIIDDLGAEKQTEWSQEVLYSLINRAYEERLALFIGTNLTIEEFQEKYGDRIFSRINEMCELVELSGEDKRFQ